MTRDDAFTIKKALENELRIMRYHYTTQAKRLHKVEGKIMSAHADGETAMAQVRRTKVYTDYMKQGARLRRLESAVQSFEAENGIT